MTVLVVHPTGNQSVRAVLRGLDRGGLRPQFYTTIALPPVLVRRLARVPSVYHEMTRRTFEEVPYARIRTTPLRELVRQTASRLGLQYLVVHETGWASTDAIYQALDRRVARAVRRRRCGIRAVYAYEDGALATFDEARRASLVRFYHLPIAYWRQLHRILAEERELRPQWAPTIGALRDSTEKCARKDAELLFADCVVVSSRFVAESLALAPNPPARVEILPYGAPVPSPVPLASRRPQDPLRILFAGHLRQRKGVAYLFEALAQLQQPHELTLAGPLPAQPCPALERELAKPHRRWLGVLPHLKLLEAMRAHHVFVFPSLAEGFGLVVTEALANGLPVITTAHTCAPEVIRDGVEGFIVPIRDPDAIAQRLTLLYENEDRRCAMGEAARRRAAEIKWTVFEDRIADLVRRLTA